MHLSIRLPRSTRLKSFEHNYFLPKFEQITTPEKKKEKEKEKGI